MRLVPYHNSVPGRLEDEFAVGFRSVSIEGASHGRAVAVWLCRQDGTGLRVRSIMHDLAERHEVGALEFTHADRIAEDMPSVGLPDEFGQGAMAYKLVLSDEGTAVESGLALVGKLGTEMVFVAGAYPYTVSISAPFLSEPFEPGYPLSCYSRTPIEQ